MQYAICNRLSNRYFVFLLLTPASELSIGWVNPWVVVSGRGLGLSRKMNFTLVHGAICLVNFDNERDSSYSIVNRKPSVGVNFLERLVAFSYNEIT